MAEKVNQGIELVKAGANVLGQFYQDLAQPSVKALGQALATVFELCPNSLLSLKLWTEKRKLKFAKRNGLFSLCFLLRTKIKNAKRRGRKVSPSLTTTI